MNPLRQQRRAREQARLTAARRRPRPMPSSDDTPDLSRSVAGEEDPGASIDLADAPPQGRTPEPPPEDGLPR